MTALGAASIIKNARKHPNAVTTSGSNRVAKRASANPEIALVRISTSASSVVTIITAKSATKPQTT